MKVIEYIREKGFDALAQNYGIKINKYPDRVVLNYDQIESPKTADIVKKCRGLILSLPDLKVLCRSFDRFYNYGEGGTGGFDFSKAVCQEKLDGTLISLYYDGKDWCFSTRGMAFAEGAVAFGDGKKFIDIVNEIVERDKIRYDRLPIDSTYIFELTSPFNRIVTKYTESTLTLLTIRNNKNGNELSFEEIDYVAHHILGVPRPKFFRLLNLNMVMQSIRQLHKLEEGYVCLRPDTFERVKVKNPSYVAIAHLRENGKISEKRIIQLIFEEGVEEFLIHFPEDIIVFNSYIGKYQRMLQHVIELQAITKDIKDQKEFASIVAKIPVSGILFMLRKGVPFKEVLNNMTLNSKIKLINSY